MIGTTITVKERLNASLIHSECVDFSITNITTIEDTEVFVRSVYIFKGDTLINGVYIVRGVR